MARFGIPLVVILVACVAMVSSAIATPPAAGLPLGIVDSETRWQFSTIPHATIDSSVIRVGDVLRPLHRSLAAWPRLRDATIGLMPIDGSPAKLDRDRVAAVLASAEATPEKISIHGDSTITVHRTGKPAFQAAKPRADLIAPVSYATPTTIASATIERIERWIEIGLEQQHTEIERSFDYQIEVRDDDIGTLDTIEGIREIEFVDEAPDWAASVDSESNPIITRVHVLGRGRGRTCEGTVTIRWQPRPAIVVTNKPLRRGHRVSRFDLIRSPRPRSFGEKPCVEDPEDLIGLEVTGNVRANVPLLSDDFAAPIAIRRGELIEVRVAGGGVQVTTAAKSLGEGSIGDLIEVETLQPRRRLIARVLDSTMVEILTAPQRSRGKIR